MNDLFSSSFSGFQSSPDNNNNNHVIEMTETTLSQAPNLEKFFSQVETVKQELKELELQHNNLKTSHELSKTLHSVKAVKDLRCSMDADVALSLKKAKLIKSQLEALDQSNEASRSLSGLGIGSSSDRTRTSVVNGLRKNMKDMMDSFNSLREQISSEYRETVQRRYYTVTGDNADDKTIDLLISTGESETFLQKAIQEQGRASIMDTIQEIEERHGAVKQIERNLNELHQVFLDMSVLVQTQGEHLDDIESHMARADSYIRGGVQQLQVAKKHQKNTRKCTCVAIVVLLIITLVIVLPIVLKK
ncbi:hypothetical protein Lal_00018311 [Lupinus albus]|uniref:Uncharacterized protein n=1 Tax=Lupinus albus TaxID=3870 RepID=A0A6A5M7P3_LUPAL|nr:hypothetical protein Lalb_Chr25g0287951 [Lupinus albus]KAF1866925.1 hypothetical protein Lal_00018311 [Lupinus albus]